MATRIEIQPHQDVLDHPDEIRCPECGAPLAPGAIWAHRFYHWGDDIPSHEHYEGARQRRDMLRKLAEEHE